MEVLNNIWNQIVAQVTLHPQLAWFLGIGIVAGWLAGFLLGGGGLLRNLVVGVIGSFIGAYVLQLSGYQLPGGFPDWVQQIITATIGAMLVVVIARIISR